MKTFLARCLLVSLPLAVSACAVRPYPAYAIEDDAETVTNAVVADSTLQGVVRVGRALVERKEGLLHVVVPVRNVDDEPIRVLAQISFLDTDRRPVGDSSNQQVKVIDPGNTLETEWVSRGREASDYVLRLSWDK
ncbi:MAG: hypothetical protein U1E73_03240 [Planctomycetota bacterium]